MDKWSVYGWIMINDPSFAHHKDSGEFNFFSYKDEDTRDSIRLLYKGEYLKAYVKDIQIEKIV